MELCQYEFQYYTEHRKTLDKRLGELFGIDPVKVRKVVDGDENHRFTLHKKDDNNFSLHMAYRGSCLYFIIIRCEKKYEEGVRNILFDICKAILEEDDQDFSEDVKDVILEQNNWFNRFESEFKISDIIWGK